MADIRQVMRAHPQYQSEAWSRAVEASRVARETRKWVALMDRHNVRAWRVQRALDT